MGSARSRARRPPPPTRSSELQQVDRFPITRTPELMGQDQLAVAIDADDDGVRSERPQPLGERPAAGLQLLLLTTSEADSTELAAVRFPADGLRSAASDT